MGHRLNPKAGELHWNHYWRNETRNQQGFPPELARFPMPASMQRLRSVRAVGHRTLGDPKSVSKFVSRTPVGGARQRIWKPSPGTCRQTFGPPTGKAIPHRQLRELRKTVLCRACRSTRKFGSSRIPRPIEADEGESLPHRISSSVSEVFSLRLQLA